MAIDAINYSEENTLINDEVSKFSWKTIRKFEELFPCKNPLYTIEVKNKEYMAEQNLISLKMKVAQNQGVEFKATIEQFTTEMIKYESPEEFWIRWKKFGKVRSFI